MKASGMERDPAEMTIHHWWPRFGDDGEGSRKLMEGDVKKATEN